MELREEEERPVGGGGGGGRERMEGVSKKGTFEPQGSRIREQRNKLLDQASHRRE